MPAPTASRNSIHGPERLGVLDLGRVSLALLQRDIRRLESIADVEKGSSRAPGAVGDLPDGERVCPVFCLDALTLQPRTEIPDSLRFCVVLGGAQEFALACEDFRMLDEADAQKHPLPSQLRGAPSPIDGILISDQRVLLRTSATALWAHILRRCDPPSRASASITEAIA